MATAVMRRVDPKVGVVDPAPRQASSCANLKVISLAAWPGHAEIRLRVHDQQHLEGPTGWPKEAPEDRPSRWRKVAGQHSMQVHLDLLGYQSSGNAKKGRRLSRRNVQHRMRPLAAQTSARSLKNPAENACRVPMGLPFGFPDWPGFHCVGLLTSVRFGFILVQT